MIDLPAPGEYNEVELQFSQRDFDHFARISGDDNPIHVDPAFSSRTRFGRTVAHGMFLFGHFAAAMARWFGGPLHVLDQRLVFMAPTFADVPLRMRLDAAGSDGSTLTLEATLHDSAGQQTAAATSLVSRSWQQLPTVAAPPATASVGYKGIEVGMRAAMARSFTEADVAGFCELVDDPNSLFRGRDGIVPQALIGGDVSRLLGVELPGPGANWLKQHYHFLRPVAVGSELRTNIEVSRLRPEKALVNLRNSATVGGSPVMTGETLVLAADVADRST